MNTLIFVIGGGVFGIALASAFIGLMASSAQGDPAPRPNPKSTN